MMTYSVRLHSLTRLRLDHDGAGQAALFLECRMAVVPEGTALPDREAVDEGFARRDAREADARDAVHPRRQQDAVPVYRARDRQPVGHSQGHGIALAPVQDRSRQLAVDGRGHLGRAGEIDRHRRDVQVEFGAAQHRVRGLASGQQPRRREAGECRRGAGALQEAAAPTVDVRPLKNVLKHDVPP